MSIRGGAYVKTTWGYQERPVASAKLNQWDDRIEAALEMLHFLVCRAWGGGDGVLRGVTLDDLRVRAASSPSLRVDVGAGWAFIDGLPFRIDEKRTSAPIAAPTTDPRIDLVEARLDAWDIRVRTGVEAASPVAPEPESGGIALAYVHCRPGMTQVLDADNGVDGWIVDARTFV